MFYILLVVVWTNMAPGSHRSSPRRGRDVAARTGLQDMQRARPRDVAVRRVRVALRTEHTGRRAEIEASSKQELPAGAAVQRS
ncbi:MAG: hypothetical protein ACYDA6_11880 [Solirubrobacteraceae bacterium]